MTSLRLVPLALTALSLAACAGGTPTPGASTAAATPSAAAASPSAAAAAYRYSDLDLCAATDLAPLAGLKLTVQDERRTAPAGHRKGEGEACLHEMKTAGGHTARLTVEAIPAASADAADAIYRAVEQDAMKADGAVAGPWEQGAGRTLDTTQGYRHSEYLVHGVSGNLHVSVWLAVGGDEYTPKEKLAPLVKAVAEQVHGTVARAWR
ncbi:hypothetical protein [Catellatospora sp. NPDC049609]|uniref:hypothetical protein n=1 Tax=Catellatospora sp. NPDC049609 TaxID=3155505 RepID=UPI003424E735